MKIVASSLFLRFKKKAKNKLQLEIDNHVKKILDNPEAGELKTGDLAGIRVHKFSYESQQYLLSYKYSANELHLYTIGSHENFYRKLKGYLK